MRRILFSHARLVAALLLAPTAALLGGCDPGVAGQVQSTAPAPELKWEELIPKSWDPTKRYRNISLEALRDNDPRAIQMLDEMRAVWDNAPVNVALDGKAAKLAGFVVPLDNTQDGIREFLLVPYFGACIHTPPPPANQIVHVVAASAVKGLHAMDTVYVSGMLKAARYSSVDMGVSGYEIQSAAVERFVPKQPQ
ncbi:MULTISPECIES: DUF3299 domain-containing protein [unclassified Variovorax]|jgi:hypothetical protein|uniref:DUF3299 domain-containing protein n=1 Tax=unclassified Variovorax TaxID=663243 RepID=UPI000F7F0FDA|nr:MULTISPECIES: DUF3299 domain-containing protein [unclassified Variovorax]RSZ34301.1 DUF3299 domain-containing protein [Variovorax sp. 553]RSZ34799.1 DUF3299 domain-containing protein [Variovorax sp. 679]